MKLEQVFSRLIKKYSDNNSGAGLWNELVVDYNDAGRYYHTLTHLNDMYKELCEIEELFADWDAVLFALFYHDIVYKINRTDNEAESADTARNRMSQISVPDFIISKTVLHILASKGHSVSDDNDTNLFTDADLSVLGQSRAVYKKYRENVRKEYFIYPDNVYNPGRKRVLQHFLNMAQIYKTPYFYQKFETRARENIESEIALL